MIKLKCTQCERIVSVMWHPTRNDPDFICQQCGGKPPSDKKLWDKHIDKELFDDRKEEVIRK